MGVGGPRPYAVGGERFWEVKELSVNRALRVGARQREKLRAVDQT